MDTPETATVEITQADRDAAAALIEDYWSGADASMMKLARSYRDGYSQGAFVRAFARHRTRATRQDELREAAQAVLDQLEREGGMVTVAMLRLHAALSASPEGEG